MSLAALIVRIGADLTDLNRGLTQAERDVQKVGKRLAGLGKSLSQNLTAPIAAAAAAMGAATISAGKYADVLGDLRDATGLSTDTLQEFRHVALSAGVESDALANAAVKLTSALSSGDEQSKQMTDALGRLGLSATDSNGRLRSMDTLMPSIIGKLQAMQDATLRNTIAADVFGKSWAEIAPILAMSGDEMAAARKEAHDLGLVMSKGSLDAADNFRKSLDRLQATGGAVAREFGVAFMPVMQGLVNLMQNAVVPAVRGIVGAFNSLPASAKAVIGGVAGMAAAIGPLIYGIGKLMTLLPALKVAFAALTGPIGLTAIALTTLVTMFALSGRAARKAQADLDAYKAALGGATKESLELQKAELARAKASLEARKASLVTQITALPQAGTADFDIKTTLPKRNALGREMLAVDEQLRRLAGPLDATSAQLKTLTELEAKAAAAAKALAGGLGEVGKTAFDRMLDQMHEMDDVVDRIVERIRGIGSIDTSVTLAPSMMTNNAGALARMAKAGTEHIGPPVGLKPKSMVPTATDMNAHWWRMSGTERMKADGSRAVGDVLSAGIGGSQIGGMVEAFAAFGPLAALLPVINGALETLGPVVTRLIEPLVEVGRIIGEALAPVLEMLTPAVQLIADLFIRQLAPILKVVTIAFSYVMEALGWLVRGIGKLIDAIPGISAKGIINAGQAMMDAARAARENSSATDDATKAVNAFASSLSNIPRVLNVNALRHLISGTVPPDRNDPVIGRQPTGTKPGGETARGMTTGGNITYNITINGATDPVRTAEELERRVDRTQKRGGITRFSLVPAT